MQLPFTVDQFFDVFRRYNETVWPAQWLLLLLAVTAVILVMRPTQTADRWIAGILALLWGWLALAYHLAFFARINPLAFGFAALSLAGAWVFLWQGVIRRCLHFRWRGGVRQAVGAVLIIYALVVYPLWSGAVGHGYPEMPTFGLPCPTTLFSVGLLAFLERPHPRAPLIVPVIWSLVGAQAAFLLGVLPDLGLLVAALAGLWMLWDSRLQPDGQ